jgi:hypothetical protein
LKSSLPFRMFLVGQPRDVAISHLYECLATGGREDEGWLLLEDIHGPNWKLSPGKVLEFLDETIEKTKTLLTASTK